MLKRKVNGGKHNHEAEQRIASRKANPGCKNVHRTVRKCAKGGEFLQLELCRIYWHDGRGGARKKLFGCSLGGTKQRTFIGRRERDQSGNYQGRYRNRLRGGGGVRTGP